MRKRSARKWLHFILDLLPVIFIPVFMVYSHRHTIDNYTAQVEETKVVDFNQQVNFPQMDYSSNHIDMSFDGNGMTIIVTDDATGFAQTGINFDIYAGHKYLVKGTIRNENVDIEVYISGIIIGFQPSDYIAEATTTVALNPFYVFVGQSTANGTYVIYPQCFDLTQMFGSGNEPTVEQFNAWYTEDYYDYTSGRKEILYTGNYITYDHTDILSQIMYAMYNATDKYFNFNKLFNMQDLYNWVQVNFFGGNAPLIIPIVWNIIVYELFMDILFLIYAVFMFIVDFATNMVDSFLSKSSKGGY